MAWKFKNEISIYIQLVDRIKMKILNQEFKPGEKLPSVRDFAQDVGVNPNTMQKALQQLEIEKLIITERTSGKYVTKDIGLIENIKIEIRDDLIKNFMDEMMKLNYKKIEIKKLIESFIESGGENE